MKKIVNQTFDEERALYGSSELLLNGCRFDGPADGESALKESSDLTVTDCYFNLRYPLWHDSYLALNNCTLTEKCRAALWYTHHAQIADSRLHGIKALRECGDIALIGCDIVSPEFGWSVKNCTMQNCTAESEYFMLRSENLQFEKLTMQGKYSFQYIKNAVLENCVLHTKDAFWHSENVTVKDSVISGEYLGWYASHLTLVRCKISGTQPLCYCEDLTLIDCEMTDTDLCFERSQVQATLLCPIDSIKNPRRGTIRVPEVREIIMDDPLAKGVVLTK